MKSIGISLLYDKSSSNELLFVPPIQLHLNLWKSMDKKRKRFNFLRSKDNKNSEEFYLDIGIMARFSIKGIKVYLPFKLRKEIQWNDLSNIITKNESILCALFNEDYHVKNSDGNFTYVESPYAQLEIKEIKEKKTDQCCVCEFIKKIKKCLNGKDEESPINFKSTEYKTPDSFYIYSLQPSDIAPKNYSNIYSEGTIFSISVPKCPGCKDDDYYYIRLRVPISDNAGLAYNTDLSNDWLQSAFTELDMYNIQINELRDIPDKAFWEMRENNYEFASFSKIHVLYISTPQVKVENGSRVKSDSRLIESESWKPYIPTQQISDAYLAHHWKFSTKDDPILIKLGLFFTAEFPKIHWRKVTPYILIVVLLGCVGSIIASFICGGSPPVLRNVFIVLIISTLFYFFWYVSAQWWVPFI